MSKRLLFVALGVSVSALAGEPDPKDLRACLEKAMHETKLVPVQLSGPVSEFKPDHDPNTLEVVFMVRKEDGPSRVSDDGKVIFLYNASGQEFGDLVTKAFAVRWRKRCGVASNNRWRGP
jgi:hypothetical protein